MSEKSFETVSSCIDNFKCDDERFDEIIKDEHLSATWDRYHLVGDILRNDTPDVLTLDVSAQIAQAIADEPTVLAPKVSKTLGQNVRAKVIQLAKPFGQLAIAASAAGLMIIGVQTNVAENETVMPSQVVKTIPLAGIAEPVSLNFQQPDKAAQKKVMMEQQRRLYSLLSDHQQQVKLSAVVTEKKQQTEKAEQTNQ